MNYKKRGKNEEKEIESAKKNSESNLINHFFSFFSNRSKSYAPVEAYITTLKIDQSNKEKLIHLFFNTIHLLNLKRGRKYVNRKLIFALFNPDDLILQIPEIVEILLKINGVTIEQFCEIFRRCSLNFFRKHSIDFIMTSKRISCLSKDEHLRKRRKIVEVLL